MNTVFLEYYLEHRSKRICIGVASVIIVYFAPKFVSFVAELNLQVVAVDIPI